MFLLIFLSCPFHFTLLSLQSRFLFLQVFPFPLYVPSFFEIMSNFRACSFQNMFIALGHWFFSCSSMPVFAFSVLYFFQRSSIFLSLYFTLFQCISFPSTFLSCALSSMSFHCLVISFHCPSMPRPKFLTDRIFGMHDRGHHGGHNLYV